MINFLSKLLKPFRYLYWFFFQRRKREAMYLKNWRAFAAINSSRINAWVANHSENEKLPVVRNRDGSYHWLTRSERRRALKSVENFMK